MNRRSFLTGIATTLLAGTAAARAAPMVLHTTIQARAWNAAQFNRIRFELGAFGNAAWTVDDGGKIEHVPIEQLMQGDSASVSSLLHCSG